MSSAQLTRLGVGTGKAAISTEGDAVPGCQWARFPEEPQDFYAIGVDLDRGADYALASITGSRVVDLVGFAGVETQRSDAPADSHCLLSIDVAAEQNLFVRYDYDGTTLPMTRQLACEKAKVAAEMAIQTLIEQADG